MSTTTYHPPRSHSHSRSKDAPSTTSQHQQHQSSQNNPSSSSSIPPHPTTPLRPSSRSSLRQSQRNTSPSPFLPSSSAAATARRQYPSSFTRGGGGAGGGGVNLPAINALEPQFAELSDSMADLEANFMHLQLLHESLARFNECFSSLLYGLEVRAFCVDFGEAPIKESYTNLKRGKYQQAQQQSSSLFNTNEYSTYYSSEGGGGGGHGSGTDAYALGNETTFMTTDTSFVENPAPSTVSSGKRGGFMGEPTPVTPAPASRSSRGIGGRGAAARGARGSGVGRGGGTAAAAAAGRGRVSGLPRGTSTTLGSGRGVVAGRGGRRL